jgi:hypothetical protein
LNKIRASVEFPKVRSSKSTVEEVDAALIGWIKQAFESAG